MVVEIAAENKSPMILPIPIEMITLSLKA